MPTRSVRTITYGLLSTILGLAYAAAVLIPTRFLRDLSSLAVAIVTLTLALLLRPAWRRSQHAIHRRFRQPRPHRG